MDEFRVGQCSLDVCKAIVRYHSEITSVKIIAHTVETNWRQRHRNPDAKLEHMLEGFEHARPVEERNYPREEFVEIGALDDLGPHQVWSMTSLVKCIDGQARHIPMMNFHPEHVGMDAIRKALKYICAGNEGVLLNSGRFTHYYGNFLVDPQGWIAFNAQLLMPTVLVSPRYIGHRLYDGYSTLRLTADMKYKPTIPHVVELV